MENSNAIILSGTDYDLPSQFPAGLAKYSDFRDMAQGATSRLRSCWDTVVGRRIAVKSLLPHVRDDHREYRRLLREARVTAQLQHPNTVPVYEIGHDPTEGLFFTMKRISGENFFEALKRIARKDTATMRDFPLDRRLAVVVDMAQALAYAHARGVIHRDVKPENIWVGNFGEVILLDWGVAKVWGHPDDHDTTPATADQLRQAERELDEEEQELTLAGQRPGTPLYMSPEQVEGRHIDERTDIFSTGVVLYEMLTISEPFRGRTIDETFDNILNRDPVPPSERASQAGLPATFDPIVMKALAKRPERRYQSMEELIDAMYMAQRSIESHVETRP